MTEQHPTTAAAAGPAAAGARPGGDPGRDVRAPVGRVPARRLPAVHARRPRRADLGRRRERVRRPDVQLRAGRARPPAPGGGGGRGGAGRPRRLPERSRPGHGGPRRAAGADRAATPTGRCSPRTAPTPPPCAARSPGRRPGGRRSWSPRAPTTAPRPGARRGRPASPRRTAPTSATTPTTTSPACSRPPPRRATTWPASWSARSSTTPGTTRSWSTPRSPAACARCATPPGAALILDDVRCGFRLHLGSSWEPVGVDPDLSAWSKAIANGQAARRGAGQRRVPRRGAAGVRHRLVLVLRRPDGGRDRHDHGACGKSGRSRRCDRAGAALRDGILAQARAWDLAVNYTGPAGHALPHLRRGRRTTSWPACSPPQALRGGAYLHPRHNWFVSAAMTGDDLALALEATDQAFAAVRKHLGQ